MGKDELSRTAGVETSRGPRWRRTLAGAVDAAIVGAAAWLWRRRAASTGARQTWWGPLLGSSVDILREQLRSPGQRMLGLRTVDRRTGRRPELWRTLVLLGAGAGGQLLVRRITPAPMTPEQESDRDTFLEELTAIQQRHPDDPAAREAERRALFERNRSPVVATFGRAAGPKLVVGLLNSRLRRRLAPTIQVLTSRGESHNP